eukprot:gene62800-85886_t
MGCFPPQFFFPGPTARQSDPLPPVHLRQIAAGAGAPDSAARLDWRRLRLLHPVKPTSISRPLAVSASAVAVLIGGTALVAWNLGRWHIMTTGPDEVPMAPPTALGFVLLGGALAARLIKPTARAAQTAATLAA